MGLVWSSLPLWEPLNEQQSAGFALASNPYADQQTERPAVSSMTAGSLRLVAVFLTIHQAIGHPRLLLEFSISLSLSLLIFYIPFSHHPHLAGRTGCSLRLHTSKTCENTKCVHEMRMTGKLIVDVLQGRDQNRMYGAV